MTAPVPCAHKRAEETKVQWCSACGAMRVWRKDRIPAAFDPWVLPESAAAGGGS